MRMLFLSLIRTLSEESRLWRESYEERGRLRSLNNIDASNIRAAAMIQTAKIKRNGYVFSVLSSAVIAVTVYLKARDESKYDSLEKKASELNQGIKAERHARDKAEKEKYAFARRAEIAEKERDVMVSEMKSRLFTKDPEKILSSARLSIVHNSLKSTP